VPLEENRKLIYVSSFTQGDKTIMHIRLHACTIEEALGNRKAFPIARAIRAPCQHSDLARFTPG
jgi:hypothetical protein